MDMMGGKLEKKLEVVAKKEEIVRPKWMEGNPKKFTKEQHIEIKAFDAMLKVGVLFFTKILNYVFIFKDFNI